MPHPKAGAKQKRRSLMWKKAVGGAIAAIAAVAFGTGAVGQADFPNHTIKIVVPSPPGPTLDSLPRVIASSLSKRWSVPVIIENIPGAAQNLGAEAVARAEPDGYTILAAPKGPLVISQYAYAKLGFDPNAFVPVSIFATQPTILVASAKAPFSNLPELIAYAKAYPGKVNYGSPGAGSSLQLMVEMLATDADIHLVHIPYKGLAPAEADLVAGHIDVMFDNLGSALPFITDGKYKALAVTSRSPLAELPGVPPLAATYPDFIFAEWFALVAPPKTPAAIANKFSQAVSEALRLPDVAQRFHGVSVTPVGSTPAEAAALIDEERAVWRKAVTQLGVKID
jgi:tripartite-type tricarboxylate transporter receptor subunit TctC